MQYMLFVLLLIPSFVLSITHTVKLDGTGNFTNIQAAINVANPADTVLVYPGRYYENINFNGKHGINLFSLEAVTNDSTYVNSTIIDGNQNGTCVDLTNNSRNISIRGLSITNGSGKPNNRGRRNGGGIMVIGDSDLNLTNCKVFSNNADYGGGVYIAQNNIHTGVVNLSGTKIYNNYASLVAGGVYIFDKPYILTFSSTNLCSIYGNYAAYGCDVFVDDYSSQSIVELNLDMFTVMQPTGYFAYYQDRYSCFGYTSPNMRFNIRRSYLTEIDADIYVSPNGSDANNGLTPQTPFKTIKKALYMVKPNSLAPNTVHLAEGVYTNNDEQMFPLAVKSYTKVIGAGKGQTKILNNSGTIVTLCITRNAYNILLEGFSVSNQVGSNLGMAYTSHIYIKNVAFTGATSHIRVNLPLMELM